MEKCAVFYALSAVTTDIDQDFAKLFCQVLLLHLGQCLLADLRKTIKFSVVVFNNNLVRLAEVAEIRPTEPDSLCIDEFFGNLVKKSLHTQQFLI